MDEINLVYDLLTGLIVDDRGHAVRLISVSSGAVQVEVLFGESVIRRVEAGTVRWALYEALSAPHDDPDPDFLATRRPQPSPDKPVALSRLDLWLQGGGRASIGNSQGLVSVELCLELMKVRTRGEVFHRAESCPGIFLPWLGIGPEVEAESGVVRVAVVQSDSNGRVDQSRQYFSWRGSSPTRIRLSGEGVTFSSHRKPRTREAA